MVNQNIRTILQNFRDRTLIIKQIYLGGKYCRRMFRSRFLLAIRAEPIGLTHWSDFLYILDIEIYKRYIMLCCLRSTCISSFCSASKLSSLQHYRGSGIIICERQGGMDGGMREGVWSSVTVSTQSRTHCVHFAVRAPASRCSTERSRRHTRATWRLSRSCGRPEVSRRASLTIRGPHRFITLRAGVGWSACASWLERQTSKGTHVPGTEQRPPTTLPPPGTCRSCNGCWDTRSAGWRWATETGWRWGRGDVYNVYF